MPMYAYRRDDGSTFEVFQHMADEPLGFCSDTGQQVKRIPQLPHIHGQRELRSKAWGVDEDDPREVADAEAIDGCKIDRSNGDAIFENEAAMRRMKQRHDARLRAEEGAA